MTIALVTSNHVKGTKPQSCNITVSGTDKLVIVAGIISGTSGDPGALNATFGTFIPDGTIFNTFTNTYYRSFAYYWTNPADGSTTAAITSANAAKTWMCASCWSGVSGFGTLKTGNALALTGIACAVDNMLIDLLTGNQDSATGTKDASWTDLRKDYITTTGNYGNGNMSYKLATSTSEASTWTGLTNVQLHNTIVLTAPSTLIQSNGNQCVDISEYGWF